jgi:hypothetical protein
MATTAITPDQNSVVGEIFIAAPPECVFQAISHPKQMPLWWGRRNRPRRWLEARPGMARRICRERRNRRDSPLILAQNPPDCRLRTLRDPRLPGGCIIIYCPVDRFGLEFGVG